MQSVIEYYLNISVLEWIAVILSLTYIVLAARANIWCWPAAIGSTVIYTYIFYDYYLWMDSTLQVYYFVMAIYGWLMWRRMPLKASGEVKANEVKSWSLAFHTKVIIGLSVLSIIVGYLMANYTPTHFPYIDAATTIFAIFTTYMVTQKVLENWLYWIVIDGVSTYVYIEKELYPTAFLFALYTIIVIFGYFSWKKIMSNKQQFNEPAMQ